MKTIILAVFLAGLAHYSEQKQESYTNSFGPLRPSTIPLNPIAKQCGGAGKLVQQRNTFCANPDCKGPEPTAPITLETDLVPSKDIAQLGWRVTVTLEGKEPALDHESNVPNGAVKAGQSYTFQSVVKSDPYKGTIAVKYEFFDVADKTVDLCIDVKFTFQ